MRLNWHVDRSKLHVCNTLIFTLSLSIKIVITLSLIGFTLYHVFKSSRREYLDVTLLVQHEHLFRILAYKATRIENRTEILLRNVNCVTRVRLY
ncbi:hypothetical protein PUN28_012420 [Cardiocondyla obscurior]|uniref:Uncharacterized protein n=1 Tax=Cardiocondyla obscurior TaxID=286306 RepID=A0AAW2FFU5_9HYME